MLTKKQKEVFDYIKTYTTSEGISPTQKEIKEYFGFKSFGSVQRYLKYLQEKELISVEWNGRRGIQLRSNDQGSSNQLTCQLPLLGTIAAGNPIEAIENNEKIEVPLDLFNPAKLNFCLKIQGDSMIEKGILDEDIVIIEHQTTAETGTIVAAIIDNEATLKIFKKEQDQIKLYPANQKYKPITVTNNIQIAGVLVGLLRKY